MDRYVDRSSYSIALWVYPFSIHGAILIHLSTTTNGQCWRMDLMKFSSTGQIIITEWGNSDRQLIGPILPVNIWSHVVDTYSIKNEDRLYINGTSINTTGSMAYRASGRVNILTLANPIHGIQHSAGGTCHSQSMVPDVYHGSIDDFRVYSEELNLTDISTLASP